MERWHVIIYGLVSLIIGILKINKYLTIKEKMKTEEVNQVTLINSIYLMFVCFLALIVCIWVLITYDFGSS